MIFMFYSNASIFNALWAVSFVRFCNFEKWVIQAMQTEAQPNTHSRIEKGKSDIQGGDFPQIQESRMT